MKRRPAAPARLPVVALLITVLAAGVVRRSEAGNPVSTGIHLKVLYGRYLSFAPFAIAKAERYFEAQGLDVELVHMTSGGEAVPALIRGELDVGAGMLRPAEFNAIARGAAIRIVADKSHYESGPCVSAAFVARPEFLRAKRPDSPDHLRGARISATPLSFSEYVLETFLSSKGLRLSDLSVARLQDATAANAVAEGLLDFCHVAEPFLTRTVRSGRAVVWKPVVEIVPGAQLATITYGPNLLARNRDAGLRFMVAYVQGVRQYNCGKTARNVDIISKETGLDPGIVRDTCWESIRQDGMINVESVLDFQRWAVRRGVLDAPLPPERFWDPSFLDEANKILGPPAP